MGQKTRTEYSLLNIITGLGGYALNTIIGLICRMVFTRTLSAEYLGIGGLFTNILSMLPGNWRCSWSDRDCSHAISEPPD